MWKIAIKEVLIGDGGMVDSGGGTLRVISTHVVCDDCH